MSIIQNVILLQKYLLIFRQFLFLIQVRTYSFLARVCKYNLW